MPTLTINSDYLATLSDDVILVDVTSNPVTLTLPNSHPVGKRYTVKHVAGNVETNPITVVSADGDTVDSQTNFVFTVTKQAVILHSDGANWFVL